VITTLKPLTKGLEITWGMFHFVKTADS
jgi:hypothetical protein